MNTGSDFRLGGICAVSALVAAVFSFYDVLIILQYVPSNNRCSSSKNSHFLHVRGRVIEKVGFSGIWKLGLRLTNYSLYEHGFECKWHGLFEERSYMCGLLLQQGNLGSNEKVLIVVNN